jgi:hypothetical protein
MSRDKWKITGPHQFQISILGKAQNILSRFVGDHLD